MAKNILITGANGQLGNEMQHILSSNSLFGVYYTDIEQLDITNINAINNYVTQNKINVIVNCAAYTAVDAAEDNISLCTSINTTAVENIAKVAKENNCKVIHISTDYVFDGKKNLPYNEKDTPNPQSVYGQTKLDGENVLQNLLPNDSIIIRTAWLYSSHGKNFVKTMINLGQSRNNLNVVSDQVGTPTFAGDLALAINTILETEKWEAGIYHFSNEGVCSWYDFAKTIHKIANIQDCKINPITTSEYPTKAIRPTYSVLDKNKIKQTFSIEIPHWTDSLEKCINEILNN